ncbi:phosphatidate cytidylyltransferase [Hymenobacter cellulosivorans]|uniref:Phosphatidate cytidylyltransferase n=1 Tax=Hymenobacter cellulosivorans TaxID=2932249 RepID=A0ABY4FE12_9BACT|nr:phosphatidate cytidylyltransferase [Hymenobacter cellulosivorans]UOQ54243.1 phosphatidate cytidylyltransferase [Hymenobacter cellulosivorans]
MSEPSSSPAVPTEAPADGKKPMSNLAQRVIFGVIGAVLLLGSVWYGSWTFALFFAAVQAKMLHEFYRMMREAGYKPAAILGICISLLIFFTVFIEKQFAHYDGGPENRIVRAAELTLIALALLLSVLLLLREMSAWPRENQSVVPFANVGVNLLGLFYVSLPMSLLSVVAFSGNSAEYDYRRIFALLFLVWCSDIGAYAAGKTFGKHKLAPSISPGKTWEGAIGGFLLTLVMGWALGFWLTDLSLPYRLVAAGTVAVFGPLGDLAESMLKRSVDIKDSGTIMPGHGGLLDRFDAFLFILPVLAVLQLLFGG